MSTTRVSTIAAMIATLALSAAPALAQEGRRGGGDQQQSQSRGARRRPDGNAGRQGARAQRAEPQQGNRGAERREAVPRSAPRNDNQARRAEPRRDRDNGGRDNRGRDDRWRGDRDRGPAPRYYPRNNPPARVYRYAPRPRVYAAPYGYRPYGYRPGWSLNLYFGRPYAYTYPGYYAGRNYGYGYYSIAPGLVYGSLRIVDAPRYAQVFVDGYYAGVVDDYDGIFQRLNLEPGGHQVEVEVYQGAPPLTFDVYIEPGRTVTIHARP